MQFGVTTEELIGAADQLRVDGESISAHGAQLTNGAEVSWAVGRAQRSAVAFFELLGTSAASASAGLLELGNRVAAAGGEYDSVEQRLLPGG